MQIIDDDFNEYSKVLSSNENTRDIPRVNIFQIQIKTNGYQWISYRMLQFMSL